MKPTRPLCFDILAGHWRPILHQTPLLEQIGVRWSGEARAGHGARRSGEQVDTPTALSRSSERSLAEITRNLDLTESSVGRWLTCLTASRRCVRRDLRLV